MLKFEADSAEGLDILRHSCAHLMAHAVEKLYPGAKFGIGPSIKDGFYYDIDVSQAQGIEAKTPSERAPKMDVSI